MAEKPIVPATDEHPAIYRDGHRLTATPPRPARDGETRDRCDYQISPSRRCQNLAKWTVAYITPDDGTMRRHAEARRCYWHTDDRFFPKGATGITTRGFAHG